jgi:hypothetical protein
VPLAVVLESTSGGSAGGTWSGTASVLRRARAADDEQVLVDEGATHQRCDQLAASHDEQIARSVLLEFHDRVADLPSPAYATTLLHGLRLPETAILIASPLAQSAWPIQAGDQA